MEMNNPVARLHGLLTKASQMGGEARLRDIWAEVFQVEAKDNAAVLSVHANVLQLLHASRAAIENLEGVNRRLHQKPFPKIERALAHANLNHRWQEIEKHVDPAVMTGLEHTADLLGRTSPEPTADEEELRALLQEVDALYDLVTQSEAPQQLKSPILRSLDDIRCAIRTYEVLGMDALIDALIRAAGTGAMYQQKMDMTSDYAKGFYRVLAHLGQVVAASRGAHAAVEGVTEFIKLLPPG